MVAARILIHRVQYLEEKNMKTIGLWMSTKTFIFSSTLVISSKSEMSFLIGKSMDESQAVDRQ